MLKIALHGHLSAGFGLAGGAKATGRLLEAAQCEVLPRDLKLSSHASLSSCENRSAEAVHLDLVHTNPNILNTTPGLLQASTLTAPLRIGYWAWELEQFPEGWQASFADYDEIWCPSNFCAQALVQRSPVPVVAVPHLPDWPRLEQLHQQRQQQPRRRDQPLRFLCCFDYWSTTARKNPEGAIDAFMAAFPQGDEAVELVIKTSSSGQFEAQHANLQQRAASDPRIQWCDQLLSGEAMEALLASADVFVSLHRAEGFGLVIADAMALGIPVIATGYSGNLEFMPPGSAELIPWQWQRINSSQGDYSRGAHWAEPCLKAATAAMQRLAHNPQHRRQCGSQGRAAVRERLGLERLLPIVQQRLGSLLLHPSRRELQQTQPH